MVSIDDSGDHIRHTDQFIQVKDQTHVWSQDYDYQAKDILNGQSIPVSLRQLSSIPTSPELFDQRGRWL